MSDSTTNLQQLTEQTSGNETRVNELFDAASPATIYGRDAATSGGLTFGYLGGRIDGTSVANGTVALTGSATNYVVANRSTGAVSVATTTANWDNKSLYQRLYKIVAGAASITSWEDHRAGAQGVGSESGVLPQSIKSADYTCVGTDAGTHLLHPSADTSGRTFTIPSNASVPYRIGTTLTFVNQNGAGIITIAITSDTMRLAGAGTTGSRTLAANGIATALKVTATEWLISGTGLT